MKTRKFVILKISNIFCFNTKYITAFKAIEFIIQKSSANSRRNKTSYLRVKNSRKIYCKVVDRKLKSKEARK